MRFSSVLKIILLLEDSPIMLSGDTCNKPEKIKIFSDLCL